MIISNELLNRNPSLICFISSYIGTHGIIVENIESIEISEEQSEDRPPISIKYCNDFNEIKSFRISSLIIYNDLYSRLIKTFRDDQINKIIS